MAEILLVDDQEEIRTLLTRVLHAAGHKVIVASDGEQALSFLETHNPDVVITDIFMPRMDGFDLARAMQTKPKHPVVIGMSGDYRAITHNLVTALGARTTLTKPFTPKELLAAVADALDESAEAAR